MDNKYCINLHTSFSKCLKQESIAINFAWPYSLFIINKAISLGQLEIAML